MIQPGTGQLRIARGVVLAALCLVLAAAGHAGAGGALPPAPALLAVGVLLGGAFVILADRERGLVAIMLAAVGSQMLFHLAFELTAAHGTHLGSSPNVLPPERMVLAHVAAAGVLGVLARYGESLLWGIAGLLGLTRIPSVHVLHVDGAPPVLRLLVLRTEPRSRVEMRICPRRGPPAAGVAT